MSLDALKEIVGESGWLDDSADLGAFLTEWRGTWHGRTPLVVMPASTDEVAAIVRHAARHRIAIVPQGGNTGLCGGAIPDTTGDQVLLSLRRMNRIRAIDADNFSLVAEAGCVLANLQQAARDVDRLLPLSLAAEGSCQIGGNVSTNAGGTNVLRYGTARDQVLGLEVVLPDGQVIDGLRALRKDTAGYDVKQLFIGAEGTLGVITAACLRLFPAVNTVATAFAAVATPAAAVRLLAHLRTRLGDRLLAFELLSATSVEFVTRHVSSTRRPLDEASPWFVLCDADCDDDRMQDALAIAVEDGLVSDAIMAKNDSEREALWHLRHSVSEAQKFEGASLKHDVSVPVTAIGDFMAAATRAAEEVCPGCRIVAFGHVGDGNVHFNVSQPVDSDAELFLARRERMARVVHDVVARFNGSFSAEHGVGVLKRDDLTRYRGAEVEVMRAVKRALDPHNIMNPGKVL